MSVLEPISETFTVPANHPSLPGHFPGNPVVPGVVLLEAVEQVLVSHYPEYDIVKLPQAKFTHLVRPEQAVDLQIEWTGNADAETLKARFKLALSEEAIPAATGQLVLRNRAAVQAQEGQDGIR
jgi:3-hydroxymyristoyl/3-hydroxydecanoyl-(acyl carrier protein) dehydratases